MRRTLAASLVGLLALSGAAQAQAQEEIAGDPPVTEVSDDPAARAIAENEASCAGGAAAVDPGFVTLADVDGDGVNDVRIDYGGLTCDGSYGYCGSGGCTQEIWLGDRDGPYRLLVAGQITQIEFPAHGHVRLTRDGGWCGLSGAEICIDDYEVRDGTLVPVP